MSIMQYGIVVSAGSKIIRRVVVPDNDATELSFHPVAAGEEMLVADLASAPAAPDVSAILDWLVHGKTGVVPPSSRCAVVVKANAISGNVVDVKHADPAFDSVPGAVLMLHPTVAIGWTWSASSGLQPPASAV